MSLAEGVHLLSVEVTDAAGNTGPQSVELAVTVDTTAPAKPAAVDMLASSDSGVSDSDNMTNINAPAFAGAGAEANAWPACTPTACWSARGW